MVTEYAAKAYEPAAAAWHTLRDDNLAGARAQAAWLERVKAGWDGVKVYAVEDDAGEARRSGSSVTVTVQLYPGTLGPERPPPGRGLRLRITNGRAFGDQRRAAGVR